MMGRQLHSVASLWGRTTLTYLAESTNSAIMPCALPKEIWWEGMGMLPAP